MRWDTRGVAMPREISFAAVTRVGDMLVRWLGTVDFALYAHCAAVLIEGNKAAWRQNSSGIDFARLAIVGKKSHPAEVAVNCGDCRIAVESRAVLAMWKAAHVENAGLTEIMAASRLAKCRQPLQTVQNRVPEEKIPASAGISSSGMGH